MNAKTGAVKYPACFRRRTIADGDDNIEGGRIVP